MTLSLTAGSTKAAYAIRVLLTTMIENFCDERYASEFTEQTHSRTFPRPLAFTGARPLALPAHRRFDN
jgi:hypothetical protein